MSTNEDAIILKTAAYVENKLAGESSGHDWWHVYRVWKTSIRLAALLHDIADWKFHGGDDTVGPRLAREWLQNCNADEHVIAHVGGIIKDMSFKGANVPSPMRTIEGMVVQDADRLDALGAVGIARTFAYGGHKGREIYNPEIKPELHQSFEQYKNSKGPTINHFYEKLLLLKDRMNTKTAKRMAEKRHEFMEQYLSEFFEEWEGKD